MVEIAIKHHAEIAWSDTIARIRLEMARTGSHPSRTVVLLPYAQLMAVAKNAWQAGDATGAGQTYFYPRFETTQNWAASLGSFVPAEYDLRLDMGVDMLIAKNLLSRAGLGAHSDALALRLVEAAWSLAKVVAAVVPGDRAAWANHVGQALGAGLDSEFDASASVLALETAVERIAVAWAANSSYLTDRLFSQRLDLLVVIEGFQTEPLSNALRLSLGDLGIGFSFVRAGAAQSKAPPDVNGLTVRQLQEAEEEAQVAASCVIDHLNQGRQPVALVAVDRLLTRRIRAMLGEQGVAVRDETGWKLSTTRAAATVMGLIDASRIGATTDQVLEWLKGAPRFRTETLVNLEVYLRKSGARNWQSIASAANLQYQFGAASDSEAQAGLVQRRQGFVQAIEDVRQKLVGSRSLTSWLVELRQALKDAEHWPDLTTDPAGLAVLNALRLHDGSEQDLAQFTDNISAYDFKVWVRQTLEAESFSPIHPDVAQVVILPLSQLLGRSVPAVVLPGCDEKSLPLVVEPPGRWTRKQRAVLGLSSREELARATTQAWLYALSWPKLDILCRTSEAGETLQASSLVQLLLLEQEILVPHDPGMARHLTAAPMAMPRPSAAALPMRRLSSSAYEDLRRCPYRFFALRQLKLQETQELDEDLGKREFGNWLHSTLHRFHETLSTAPAADLGQRQLLMDAASAQSLQALSLTSSEFLPFAAGWPRVRDGYLQWLATHEAAGSHYLEGEVWKEMQLGDLKLVGKIDRIDRRSDGTALVIDYKTESATVTAQRVRDDAEDTQLAFYAALLHDDVLAGAYVNVGEKEVTKTYNQNDIVVLRDQLVEGILDDMQRLNQGAELPALGEGRACDFCAARGMCRKDFWAGV